MNGKEYDDNLTADKLLEGTETKEEEVIDNDSNSNRLTTIKASPRLTHSGAGRQCT
jgi:hypothetical protein